MIDMAVHTVYTIDAYITFHYVIVPVTDLGMGSGVYFDHEWHFKKIASRQSKIF